MTTLSGLKEGHWTYFCEMTIREFFLNPNFTTMCIFFSHNRLVVTLSFPLILVNEFTYFIREPREVLRAETFRNDILFGTVNDKPEYYVLSIVENVLAPIFLKVETWPDSILLINPCVQSTKLFSTSCIINFNWLHISRTNISCPILALNIRFLIKSIHLDR
ncbi:hypothetical protein HZU73_09583 [Apis mellifera caucasica]|nr:hypothetical protein HZU73_09583 [Apis mellifera caucasica]KAG9428548.1 hypothetical protein HZU67_09951 [Apis mellifera carnica]